MKTLIVFIFLSLLIPANAVAQTREDFGSKFGASTYYEVRPTILMSAEFDSNGQVCRVTFQPNFSSKKERSDYPGLIALDVNEVELTFDEIVMPQYRSGKPRTFGMIMMGGMIFGGFELSGVGVGLKSGSSPSMMSRKCKSGEDGSRFCLGQSSPQIVTIAWKGRDCDMK